MKLSARVFGRILALVLLHTGFLIYALKSSVDFRSQNILYHLGLAKFYQAGDFWLSGFSALSHSDWGGRFIDQHKIYSLLLALMQQLFTPERSAFLVSLGATGLAMVALSLLIRDLRSRIYPSLNASWLGDSIVFLCVPLVLLYASEDLFNRWLSGRPNALHFAFLCFLCLASSDGEKKSALGRNRLVRPLAILFGLSFLWAGFSFFALLAPVFILTYKWAENPKDLRKAVLFSTASLAGVLCGFFFAAGARSIPYAVELIQKHLFQASGINEWSTPWGPFAFVAFLAAPLALGFSVYGIFSELKTQESSEPAPRILYRLYFPVLAFAFAFGSLLFSRLLDLSWPLSLLALSVSIGPEVSGHFRKPLPKILTATAVGALAIAIFLQVHRFSKLPMSDHSLRPEALGVMAEVQSLYPDRTIVISNWTNWSAAFYLNQKTRIEPGFSPLLYPAGVRTLLTQLANPIGTMSLDEISALGRVFETDLFLLADFQVDRIQAPKELLLSRYGYSLIRIFPSRGFRPLANEKPCGLKPLFAELLVFDAGFKLLRQTKPVSVSAFECESGIQKLSGAPKMQEYRVLRLWSEPEPLHDTHQIRSPESLGHFGFLDEGHLRPSEILRALERLAASAAPKLSPTAQSLREDLIQLDESNFELRGRVPAFKRPTKKVVCESYQNGFRALLKRGPQLLEVISTPKDHSQRLRNMLAASTLCQRPAFVPDDLKAAVKTFCTEANLRINARAANSYSATPGFVPSEALMFDLYSQTGTLALAQIPPPLLLTKGRMSSFAKESGDQKNSALELFQHPPSEIFTSGQLALWWTTRWATADAGEFEEYLARYEELYRTEYNYNIFLVRWWSEALVHYYRRTSSVRASRWMELFFRATETMVKGPTREGFAGCLGPSVPGLGVMPYPNHNAGLLLEGLEQARGVDFPWWSEKEEYLLEGLLRCTLALQARAPFWPSERLGEFIWTPGDEVWRPDVQAHLLNALGHRLENDEISCEP